MIKVIVIEDDNELRKSLEILLNNSDGFTCINSFNSCESALEYLEKCTPDVILMDIELAGCLSGIEGVKIIKKKMPEINIIMLTIHEDNDCVFQSLRNGASGYLVKNSSLGEITNRINEVQNGGAPMSMSIAHKIVHSFQKEKTLLPLSKREEEILIKLCEGKSYQSIANQLCIEKTTVKFHIANIYKKLHVTNKAEAIIKVKDNNLL